MSIYSCETECINNSCAKVETSIEHEINCQAVVTTDWRWFTTEFEKDRLGLRVCSCDFEAIKYPRV